MGATHALLAVMTWLQAAPAPLDLTQSEATKTPAFRSAVTLRDTLCPLLLRTKTGMGPASPVSRYLEVLKARGKPTTADWRDEGPTVTVELDSPVFSSAKLVLFSGDAPNTPLERRRVRMVALLFQVPLASDATTLAVLERSTPSPAAATFVCKTARLFDTAGARVDGVYVSASLVERVNELDTRP